MDPFQTASAYTPRPFTCLVYSTSFYTTTH